MILSVASDNLVTLSALTNNLTGLPVNNAVVSATLVNNQNVQIWSGTLAYVSASSGNYQGTIPASVTLAQNYQYTLTITAVASGITLTVQDDILAEYAVG